MKDQEKIILDTDPEAAQYQTGLAGWVSRDGFFWGKDERAARYAGSTHRACEDCGKPTPKSYIVCSECSRKRDIGRYQQLKSQIWDETGLINVFNTDIYFESWEEAEEFADDAGQPLEELYLVISEPHYLHLIEADEWAEDLAEDGELPDAVHEAVDALNTAIRQAGPVCYFPGKIRARKEES